MSEKDYYTQQILTIIPLHLDEGRRILYHLFKQDFSPENGELFTQILIESETADISENTTFLDLCQIHEKIVEELLKKSPETLLELKEQLRSQTYNKDIFDQIKKYSPRQARRLLSLGKGGM